MIKKLVYIIASFLPKSLVYGKTFRKAKKTQEVFEKTCDKQEFISEFTQINLDRIISIAKSCDFYNSQPIHNEIRHQDFIDKNIVLSSGTRIISNRHCSDLITTGGTSGKPLAFYINKDRKGTEWFWMTAGWALVGFDYKKSWRAVLRNQSLNGKKYDINPLLKEVYFDNFKLDPNYINFITKEITRRNIEFVHAYPSAAYSIALIWRKNNNAPKCVKAFLCGSENVLPIQKKLIQEDLGIRMFTWFGHSEKLILAHEGAKCENLHSNPFYGFTELIDENNKNITTVGRIGELVGTGYINTKTPFIRYRTGDFAEYIGQTCPDCGHIGLTFKNVKGRWAGERIYLANRQCITTTALNLHDDIYTKIDGLQYYQDTIGELEVRVIINSNWEEVSGKLLIDYLLDKIPHNLKFTLKIVNALEFTKNRKYQLLIQKVKEQ